MGRGPLLYWRPEVCMCVSGCGCVRVCIWGLPRAGKTKLIRGRTAVVNQSIKREEKRGKKKNEEKRGNKKERRKEREEKRGKKREGRKEREEKRGKQREGSKEREAKRGKQREGSKERKQN